MRPKEVQDQVLAANVLAANEVLDTSDYLFYFVHPALPLKLNCAIDFDFVQVVMHFISGAMKGVRGRVRGVVVIVVLPAVIQ